MPYCSSEQRLHGYDEAEAEMDSSDSYQETVSASVSIIRSCSYCGAEAARYYADLEGTIDHDCEFAGVEDAPEGFDVDFDDPEVEDYSTTHDRRGKRISNPRYQKHLFAVRVGYTATCRACSEIVTGDVEERDIAASAFDVEPSH